MPLQIPNLDDRTYQQLVDEAVARIPAHTPEWTNFNQSDPGITLVQIFAWMSENLLYRSNRIPEANRLKFLSLLGIPLRPAAPAYALVTFNNDRGPTTPLPVEKGLELYAGKVPFRTRTDVNILPVSAVVFFKKRIELSGTDQTRQLELFGADKTSYESVMLEAPAVGKPDPVVNLRSQDIRDNALWLALIAPKNIAVDEVKGVISDQTLSVGIYPSITTELGEPDPLQPHLPEAQSVLRSGLLFDLLESQVRDQPGGPVKGNYVPLEVENAESVLKMPGIVQLRLPRLSGRTFDELEPTEEGTGNLPPLVQDRDLAERIVAWIRIRQDPASDTSDPASLTWIGVNAARVIQSLRVENERIGVGTGTPEQVLKVANTPVIIEQPLNPFSPAQFATRFTLTLVDGAGTEEVWTRVDDLYSAKADDRVYALDAESGQVRCGDGLRGKRFPYGFVVRATYEYGGGTQGNTAIAALNKAPSLPGGIKVSNPVPTWGAADGQSVADGERSISRFLRHRDRLVTAEDYREITLQTPGVELGRVEVLPLLQPRLPSPPQVKTDDFFKVCTSDQSQPLSPEPARANQTGPALIPGTVTVMVIPEHPLEQIEAPDPNDLFLEAVRAWLEPRRLLTSRIFVRGPEFIRVYVTVAIQVWPGQISAVVNRAVRLAVRTYLSPLVGGIPQPDQANSEGWPLGFPNAFSLSVNDLIAVVARVNGVRSVGEVKLGKRKDDAKTVDVVEVVTFQGLELPWLAAIDVREGNTALDPAQLAAGVADPAGIDNLVPVVPGRKC
jgi:hypothetical protein